jgi:pimeloyl-ACP methyl ester carboxylesterase
MPTALPADRTAVFGVSASAELALAMGIRHPDIYSAVFCASPGAGYQPPEVLSGRLPRTYLAAGTKETSSATTRPAGGTRCATRAET